jgi:polysaccharide biosynthesis transport protein
MPRYIGDYRSLGLSKKNPDSIDSEPAYPASYEGVFTDGYNGAANQNGDNHLLGNLLSSVRKHWFLILVLNFLVTAAAIFYVAQKPDYFQAEARVQVNSENNPAAGAGRSGASSIIVNNPGSDPAYFTTQLQILESAELLRRVAKTLDLENNPNFLDPQQGKRLSVLQNVQRMFGLYHPPAPEQPTPATVKSVENKLNLKREKSLDPDQETEKYASLVARLKKNLTIIPVEDTRLIEIGFTHGDPAVASKIANAVGDTYVLQNLEQKIQTNASAGDFMQKRVAELQSDIRLGEERLLNYSKNNQILSLDAGQNTVVQRLTDLNGKLGQAENERIAAQTAYQAAQQNQMRAVTAETKDAQVAALESKLNELRQTLVQLKTEYTDEWYAVVQTRKQIENIENQLLVIRKRASDIQIASLQEKLNETVAREKELRNNFELQRGEVIRQNEASINYRIIQQEINTNKTLLGGLLERSRENDVILNDTPNNVLVADRAVVPRSPAGPERSKNIILAFLLSLGAGCGLAFLLDWLNDSVHNSDNIENELGLPLLATIPEAPLSLSKRLIPNVFSLGRSKKAGKGYFNLSSFEKPEFLEAYLQLRTCLMLSNADGPPRVILVTSAEEGEGKTLTALHLADSLAETGDNILLIDADLRCPQIHGIKQLSNRIGLTELLTGKDFNLQTLEKNIQKNGTENLHFLTAGERTTNPANLLCSEEMRLLLNNLSHKYRHIVIDSPPVLYFADSTILSTLADAVILVVRDNVSSRQIVLKARKTLQCVGAKIVGMVINGIPMKWANYRKYQYYELAQDSPGDNSNQILKLN